MARVLAPVNSHAKARLSKKTITIGIGETAKLKVKGTKKKVKWSSSNKAIVKVSKKGKIKAKKTGSVKITAKAGKKRLVCKVKVDRINSKAMKYLKKTFYTIGTWEGEPRLNSLYPLKRKEDTHSTPAGVTVSVTNH